MGCHHISVDPSCRPGSSPKHTIDAFYCQNLYSICHWVEKRTKINKKRLGLALFITKPIGLETGFGSGLVQLAERSLPKPEVHGSNQVVEKKKRNKVAGNGPMKETIIRITIPIVNCSVLYHWSSGYGGRRLTIKRSWVRIPTPFRLFSFVLE